MLQHIAAESSGYASAYRVTGSWQFPPRISRPLLTPSSSRPSTKNCKRVIFGIPTTTPLFPVPLPPQSKYRQTVPFARRNITGHGAQYHAPLNRDLPGLRPRHTPQPTVLKDLTPTAPRPSRVLPNGRIRPQKGPHAGRRNLLPHNHLPPKPQQ